MIPVSRYRGVLWSCQRPAQLIGIILVTHAGRAGDAVGHGSFRYTAFGTNTASDAVFFHELNELCRSCA